MHAVQVVRNERAAEGLRLLTLDAEPARYTRPGQYILAHVGHHAPAFFAIASDPGAPLELLVKAEPGTAAEDLALMRPGDPFTISEAQGDGFPIERVAGLDLVVLVNGSGISGVRALLNAERGDRPVHLFFGVRSPWHRPYGWDLERWANRGIRVTTVVDPIGADGWHGAVGYVQDEAIAQGWLRADVGVVLCGLPILLEQARTLWEGAGCPPQHVLLNF